MTDGDLTLRQFKRLWKVGDKWSRTNLKFPQRLPGSREAVAERGQAIEVEVHRVTKEGVEFRSGVLRGFLSYLDWPDLSRQRVYVQDGAVHVDDVLIYRKGD